MTSPALTPEKALQDTTTLPALPPNPIFDELRQNGVILAWLAGVSSDLNAGRIQIADLGDLPAEPARAEAEGELRGKLAHCAEMFPRFLIQIPALARSREAIEQGARTELLKGVLETESILKAMNLKGSLQSEIVTGLHLLHTAPAEIAADPSKAEELIRQGGASPRFVQAFRGVARALGALSAPAPLPQTPVPAEPQPKREKSEPAMPSVAPEDEAGLDEGRRPRPVKPEEVLSDYERSIKQRLDLSRLDLVDVGLRNPLLNYRHSRGNRGVEIVNETSAGVFEQLVTEGRKIFFSAAQPPQAAAPSDGEKAEAVTADPAAAGKGGVCRISTSHTPANLQTRLLNTSREAKLYMEEQGANVLYLAAGMLNWKESESSDVVRKAPLIMIPVTLERSSVKGQFHVRYNEDEIEQNIALIAKLREEFGINLPQMPDRDDLDPAAYMEEIAQAIEGRPELSLGKDELALGFISFGKQLIYRDLDSGAWPEGRKPWNNQQILSIFGRGFNQSAGLVPEGKRVDESVDSKRHVHVMDCDSSQVRVLLDVSANADLAVEGPPGTGKSQTITNIIAQAVADGKKVLFVSEKGAALDVVKARLDQIGLGDACLELHSHKTPKKAVLEELRRTLALGEPIRGKLEECRDTLEESRAALNAYSDALSMEIRNAGTTPHQVMGRLVEVGTDDPQRIDLGYSNMSRWSGADFAARMDQVRQLERNISELGVPSQNRFYGSARTSFIPTEKAELRSSIADAVSAGGELDGRIKALFGTLGLPDNLSARDAKAVLEALKRIGTAPNVQGMMLEAPMWTIGANMLKEMLEAGVRYQDAHSRLDKSVTSGAWDEQLQTTRDTIAAYGDKWWRMFSGTYRGARNKLYEVCRQSPPSSKAERLQVMDTIMAAKEDKELINRNQQVWGEVFGVNWQGLQSNWQALSGQADWACKFAAAYKTNSCFAQLVKIAQDPALLAQAKEAVPVILQGTEEYTRKLDALLGALEFSDGKARDKLELMPVAKQLETLSGWHEHVNDLDSLASYNDLARRLNESGLGFVVERAAGWAQAGEKLAGSFEYTWLAGLVKEAFKERPALASFERGNHEHVRERFRERDRELFNLNTIELAHRHWEGLPRVNTGGQFGLLSREMEKKAKHLPIRHLLRDAGNAVQEIKPVFMMSPLSVAKFLAPGSADFDLVIFDEASQVKPVEALGAIMRAKQTVVVGDGKQLPPTSFFDSVAESTDAAADEHRTADMESILDLFMASGASRRMLTAHYRSRHESLIAVSNQEFYDNRLRVFPSPAAEKGELGLHYRHLPDTVYDRGGSRVNKLEAKAVAEAVMEHARNHPEQSLGAVAFSKPQMEAIFMEVERLRQAHPECEDFFHAHPEAPFFVKNLENVQGDERDVIFISTGYGKDKDGKLNMVFGPLNMPGGERRLNVLISRAKRSSTVFTNLAPEDLDLSRTDARGVAALKTFLAYARDGRLSLNEGEGVRAETGLAKVVRSALEAKGFRVVSRVGGHGCSIDLAVLEPANPQRYLLGISLDGEEYQGAHSARDRDRIRDEVLQSLGWNVHQVWSVAWFRDPAKELARLEKALSEAAQAGGPAAAAPARRGVERNPGELNRNQASGAVTYELASPDVPSRGVPLTQRTPRQISELVKKVVEVEGPVHFEEVERRLRKAAGIDRKSDTFEDSLRSACTQAAQKGWIKMSGDFLYNPGQTDFAVRDRSAFPSASKRMLLIAPEEIDAAIHFVARHSLGIKESDMVEACCLAFGFKSVPKDAEALVSTHVRAMINEGGLRREGEFLFPGEES